MPGVRVGVEAAISLEWVSAPALDERALGGSQKTWPSPPATTGHLGVSLARQFGTSQACDQCVSSSVWDVGSSTLRSG